MNKQNDLLRDILEKDFEELEKNELQVLRNKAREVYHIEGKEKINNETLLMVYLTLKRKLITELETILVTPDEPVVVNGVFGKSISSGRRAIPTFDGINKENKGVFYIEEPMFLPLLSLFVLRDPNEAYCLSPYGNFCVITI